MVREREHKEIHEISYEIDVEDVYICDLLEKQSESKVYNISTFLKF